MQISLILPQIVALDVVFALAACLQTIHVPLIASRRSSYNRKVICAYEASLVLHLMISALILFASSGSYLVAPLDVCARAMGGVLWLNAAIFAYGVVLMVRYRRPVMLVELLLVVAVTPPVVFAMGSAWTVVLIAEGAFFLFRSIAALLMDVRNRQEDITMFSTIETINVIPVGILYLDPRGRPLLMNRCMRKNLVELHMPTDLGDMSGTWNELRKLSMQMPESSRNRVRINLDRFGEARAVVEVSPAEIRLFVRDRVMVSGRSFERIIGLDVTEYAHAHDRLAQANHLLELAGQELQAQIEEVKKVADNAGGVRTESWTAGRSGLEVRMYSREKVELFLLATEDGMGPTAAAKFAGVSVGAAKKWATGHLPHSYTGARCRIGARKPPRKEASLGPDKSIYAPPATGPLAGLNEDQIENLLLRAVLADLKAEGWDPASISNRSKCELGERLRRATALPLRSITGFLRISKSSYEYWRPRVAAPRDRDADIRDRVVRIFREGSGCWGYRTVWARLRREGVRASEKRVARVMREEGLEVVYNKRRARGYSSYAGEVSKAPENLVNRRFRADEPNRLWLTDITEFRLPGGEKVYLSPIVDCFDGMPVAWSIGLHPDKRLANSSLLKACAARPAGARTTIHSDRGGHYRWPEWIGICEENGLVRSMSAKGCSPDNSACEGFFGRLKNEFFHYRDWEGVTAEEFMGRLEAYLVYYREERIKKSLGWLSPMEYRRKLGYA